MQEEKDHPVNARIVFDVSLSRFRDPDKSDLLLLMLRTGDGDWPFVMDRRLAERLSGGLTQTTEQLSAPRDEN